MLRTPTVRLAIALCAALAGAEAVAQPAKAALMSPAAQVQPAPASHSESESLPAAAFSFQVMGMICQPCAEHLERRLRTVPGVGGIYISMSHGVVAVEPRRGVRVQSLSLSRLVSEIRTAGNVSGYTLTGVAMMHQGIPEIRAALPASAPRAVEADS